MVTDVFLQLGINSRPALTVRVTVKHNSNKGDSKFTSKFRFLRRLQAVANPKQPRPDMSVSTCTVSVWVGLNGISYQPHMIKAETMLGSRVYKSAVFELTEFRDDDLRCGRGMSYEITRMTVIDEYIPHLLSLEASR